MDRIERAFEEVDPDQAECEQAYGVLTLRLGSGAKCILSAQPSVRQLWLAVASQAIAYHFNLDATQSAWVDDQGKGVELMTFLEGYFREAAGVRLQLKP
jgi:iron donor protein CyaY